MSGDLRRFAFNTSLSAVMELYNEASRVRETADLDVLRFALATAGSLLFSITPHVGADVYHLLSGERVWEQPWPEADPDLLARDEFVLVCQINGKVRDRVSAPALAGADELKDLCRAAPNMRTHLDGHEVVKEIVVPGKLVNFVIR